jgi:hypothetical protein
MRAAEAPVVLVMMADLSDDFRCVEDMLRLVESGVDVACASRYAPGGKQIGGPLVKGLLSQLAGVSLHYIAGVPTRDPTHSFKAYKKAFLERTPIESTAGFCLGVGAPGEGGRNSAHLTVGARSSLLSLEDLMCVLAGETAHLLEALDRHQGGHRGQAAGATHTRTSPW